MFRQIFDRGVERNEGATVCEEAVVDPMARPVLVHDRSEFCAEQPDEEGCRDGAA